MAPHPQPPPRGGGQSLFAALMGLPGECIMALIDLSAALEMAVCSDTGRVRQLNEDSVLANATLGLAVLADGMGGYNVGEVASSVAGSCGN